MPTLKSKKPSDPLVGRFFHSVRVDTKPDGKKKRVIEWQGCVLNSPQPGFYLLQLFEWLMGEPNKQVLVKIEQMTDWQFYDTADEMKEEWSRVRETNSQQE